MNNSHAAFLFLLSLFRDFKSIKHFIFFGWPLSYKIQKENRQKRGKGENIDSIKFNKLPKIYLNWDIKTNKTLDEVKNIKANKLKLFKYFIKNN